MKGNELHAVITSLTIDIRAIGNKLLGDKRLVKLDIINNNLESAIAILHEISSHLKNNKYGERQKYNRK